MPTKTEHLSVLVGEQLSAVTFVQDYLQLDFDGNVITMYQWPKIEVADRVFTEEDPEFRNVLCSLIASTVSSIEADDDEQLVVRFDNKSINLDYRPIEGFQGEVAIFRDHKGGWSPFP